MKLSIHVAILLALGCSMAWADTILLKNGVIIEGEIVERRASTDGSVFVIRDKDNITFELASREIEKITVGSDRGRGRTKQWGATAEPVTPDLLLSRTARVRKQSPALIVGILAAAGTGSVLVATNKTTNTDGARSAQARENLSAALSRRSPRSVGTAGYEEEKLTSAEILGISALAGVLVGAIVHNSFIQSQKSRGLHQPLISMPTVSLRPGGGTHVHLLRVCW